jgi:hypothetical protein
MSPIVLQTLANVAPVLLDVVKKMDSLDLEKLALSLGGPDVVELMPIVRELQGANQMDALAKLAVTGPGKKVVGFFTGAKSQEEDSVFIRCKFCERPQEIFLVPA